MKIKGREAKQREGRKLDLVGLGEKVPKQERKRLLERKVEDINEILVNKLITTLLHVHVLCMEIN